MSNDFKLKPRIAALILAAGAGERIGMPKWQLKAEGKFFLDIICDKLASIHLADVICVKRKEFEIKNPSLKYVINPTPEYGMISSVYYGIKAYPGYEAYIIWPVDHPFVCKSTLFTLMASFKNDYITAVLRPVFEGNPGHPIIIPKAVAEKIPALDFDGGLRNFITQYDIRTNDIVVEDANIMKNINTIADFKKGKINVI